MMRDKMAKTIWKCNLELGINSIPMPINAKILTAQMQFENIVVWALVDVGQNTTETRKFAVFGTGFRIDDFVIKSYIGTIQLDGGDFIGHVFEISN